jgi:glycosyltransferase involved in cell wall biosynthesis
MSRKVLIVNTPTYIGGSEISILTMARHLTPDAFSPLVLTSGEGPFRRRAVSLGLRSATLDFPWFSRRRPWRYAASIARLCLLLQRERIRIVHTNCDHSLPYVRRACELLRVPYVSHVRDVVRGWFQPAQLRALNSASAVIVSSTSMANACVKAGVTRAPVLTIYNPVDLDQFRRRLPEVREVLRSELGLSAASHVVGLVGQILPLKGHTEFIHAALGIAAEHPDTHFLVVGQPPPEERHQQYFVDLRRLVEQSPHAARFHFTGFRDDVPAVMRVIDVLAVPSWAEPFGRVAAEGMAAGCAVVASDIDGLPEVVTDGVDGLLVRPKDVGALSLAISRLLTDGALRRRLTEAGPASAERFAIDRHVEQVQQVYDRVIHHQAIDERKVEDTGKAGERNRVGMRG